MQFLPTGNMLISDFDNHRIVEIDRDSNLVWKSFVSMAHPEGGIRFKDGSYLVLYSGNNRLIILNDFMKLKFEMLNFKGKKAVLFPNGNVGVTGYRIEK